MSYTKGPWEVDYELGSVEGDRCTVAVITPHGNVNTITRTGEQFSHADAHLIAAAPDLLEACKAYLAARPQCECSDTIGCKMAKARQLATAAIAKAQQ